MEKIYEMERPHTNTGVFYAPKRDKMAYVDKMYSRDGGENCCIAPSIFVSDIDGTESELLRVKSSGPEWSHTNDTLVFSTTYGETYQGETITDQLALYDINNEQFKKLTSDHHNHYNLWLYRDGKKILFETENGATDYHGSTAIWLLDLETKEKVKVTDLLGNDLRDAAHPNWGDGEFFHYRPVGYE